MGLPDGFDDLFHFFNQFVIINSISKRFNSRIFEKQAMQSIFSVSSTVQKDVGVRLLLVVAGCRNDSRYVVLQHIDLG
jgi:hypothetical protein